MTAHAVLVPGPGLGHVNGCLLLAKALLSTPLFSHITLVCFARSYKEHLSNGRLSSLAHPSIRLEVVPDGIAAESASYAELFAITPAMHDNLASLLRRLRGGGDGAGSGGDGGAGSGGRPAPACLITDMIMAWTQAVADVVGIPRVELWTASATSYLCLVSIPQLISAGVICCHKGSKPVTGWRTGESRALDCIPGMPEFALDEVPRELRYAASSMDPLVDNFAIAAQNASRAACVLLLSAFDLEAEAFEGIRDHLGITPYAIGPLLHYEQEKAMDAATRSWLDSHAPASVMYVSFGSNAKLREAELVQLALGLQSSGHPFLLVLRKDATIEGVRPLQQLLPAEFFSHASTHGLILPWASQRAVLSHPAVGGFLSHCGWNSTIESLWMGVPILACPRAAEQPTNCRFIVQSWKVGIELSTAVDGTFSQQDVSAGVESILVGDVGQHVRSNARQLSKKLREAPVEGGHSHASLLEFASNITQ